MIISKKFKTMLIVVFSLILLGLILCIGYDVYKYNKLEDKVLSLSDNNSYTLNSISKDNHVGKITFVNKKSSETSIMNKVSNILDDSKKLSDGNIEIKGIRVEGENSDKKFDDLYLEYGYSILGNDIKCKTDLEYESKNYRKCLSRLEMLISNSNKDYNKYTDDTLEMLLDETSLQLNILNKLSSKSKDENYQKILGYLNYINQYKMDNLKELEVLNAKAGNISYDDMNSLMSKREYNFKYIYKTEINLLQQLNKLARIKGID